ncbi:MAG: hypothetical protein E7309_14040 [Butyrivibrio sp.]|nr:hypothetical protein [Butyrivibrio sp.]
MSRKERVLKKRYAIFCEGDTEYNYIDKMRKNQGVELVLKPINMHGGGYSNFLRQIKKEAQSNKYEIKKKTFDIIIKKTDYDQDALDKKNTNIEEFFDVIDW